MAWTVGGNFMRHLFLFILSFLVSSLAFSQKSSIKELLPEDTLSIEFKKIDCIYGLDSTFTYTLTKIDQTIKINTGNDSNWSFLNSEQFKYLVAFEKKGKKKGCPATSYTLVQIVNKSDTSRFSSCLEQVQELARKIK